MRSTTRSFISMRGTLGGAVMVVAGLVIAVAGDARGLLLSVVGAGLIVIMWAFFLPPTSN